MFHVRDPQGVLRPFSFRDYNKYPVGKDDHSLRHLWYSQQQAKMQDTLAVYQLADYIAHVDVTAASETINHGCLWDDMVYLGVGWYVRTKTNPLMFDSSYRMINPCKEVKLDAFSPEMYQLIQDELDRRSAASEPGIIYIDSISNSYVEPNVDHLHRRIVDQRQQFNLQAYGNSYSQVRRDLGDTGGHSGVDAPEPVSHPDNPVSQHLHIREIWDP